jgi:hypothetical protein
MNRRQSQLIRLAFFPGMLLCGAISRPHLVPIEYTTRWTVCLDLEPLP